VRFCIFLCVLVAYACLFSQEYVKNTGDSLKLRFQLEKTTGSKRFKRIQNNGHLELISFEIDSTDPNSWIYSSKRIQGQLDGMELDTLIVRASFYSKRVFNDYENLFFEEKTIYGSFYPYTLSLSEIDAVVYSSVLQRKLRNSSITAISVSLFSALIIAPLFSLEYKAYGEGTPGGFDRKKYLMIAGTSMGVAAASFTLYIATKPKYYSFAYDNFNPKRQRWTISLVR
jgi:hypothetical protein